MAEPITIDELLAAMEAASQSSSVPGLSTYELAHALGWGIDKTRRYIRSAVESGELKAARKPTIGMDGRQNWTSVYYRPAGAKAKPEPAAKAASTKGAKRK